MNKIIAAVVMASVVGMSVGAYAAAPAGPGHPHATHVKAKPSHHKAHAHKTAHHKTTHHKPVR